MFYIAPDPIRHGLASLVAATLAYPIRVIFRDDLFSSYTRTYLSLHCLQLTDAKDGWAKSSAKADNLCFQNTAGPVNMYEDDCLKK